MSLHSLIHEIHIASSGQLSTLKGRVIDSGLAGPALETGSFSQYYNLAYSHVWREFNKKCYNVGLTGLMVIPYDGGLRPIPPALSGLSNGPTTTAAPTTTTTAAPILPPSNAYLQPNGVDYYLQPNGIDYYEYRTPYNGLTCESASVTIYTNNDTFSTGSIAYLNSYGSEDFYNGEFLLGGTGQPIYYNTGVASGYICAFTFDGFDCDGASLPRAYSNSSTFSTTGTYYNDSVRITPYNGVFVYDSVGYVLTDGVPVLADCPTTTLPPTTTTTEAPPSVYSFSVTDCANVSFTIYSSDSTVNTTSTYYTDLSMTNTVAGFIVYNGEVFTASGGVLTSVPSCP
jgi:hypothetical protein